MSTAAQERRGHAVRSTVTRVSPSKEDERPLWQLVLLLYGGIFFLAVVLTTTCFVVAHFAA